MAYPTSIPSFGTQPKAGPLIVAYRENPLSIRVKFPVDYVIGVVTAKIQRGQIAVANSLQPIVLADGQVRVIELTAQQIKALYQQTELVIYFDGVAVLLCEMETTNDATRKTQGDSLEFTVGGDLVISITMLVKGDKGLDAYEGAVQNGFEGTEAEWLASLGNSGGGELIQETAIGLVNGVNAVFTSSHPMNPAYLQVFDGVLLENPDDYTVTSTTSIQLNFSPQVGEKIIFIYYKLF